MTPEQLSSRIAAHFGPGAVSDASHGTVTADVPARRWTEALTLARDELGCDFFDWLSALDELNDGFAILVHLYSAAGRHHLLLRTRVARRAPRLPTATQIYARAAGYEREAAQRSGIRFDGHPDPAPLLLPGDGLPLR